MAFEPSTPEDYARELLNALGVDRLRDLTSVLDPLRLKVVERPTSSFEGALVCRKNRSKGMIAVSNAIKEPGRRRFTICHEVGHFVLPGHGEAGCKANMIESWRDGAASKESEADRFASELLLPSKVIYPYVQQHKATLDAAKRLSAEFETSLTATSYKLVDVTEEACAIVWSTAGHVSWARKNENFFGYIPFGKLDDKSLAAELMNAGGAGELSGEVFAECWLAGGDLSAKDRIWEDSIYLPSYDAVLTILTLEG